MKMTSGDCRKVFFRGDSEVVGVNAHLPLGDDAFLMVVNKFDGIFNADDMPRFKRIPVIDQGGEGR